jgi:hypothetical protein
MKARGGRRDLCVLNQQTKTTTDEIIHMDEPIILWSNVIFSEMLGKIISNLPFVYYLFKGGVRTGR